MKKDPSESRVDLGKGRVRDFWMEGFHRMIVLVLVLVLPKESSVKQTKPLQEPSMRK